MEPELTKDEISRDIEAHAQWVKSGHGTPIDWSGKNLRNAVLAGEDLQGANMQRCILCLADMSDTDLWATDLREANMRNTNLIGASCNYANFEGADMRGALLDYRTLEFETDLWDGAIMEGVRLHKDGEILSAADSEVLIEDIFAQKGISIGSICSKPANSVVASVSPPRKPDVP